MTISDAQRSIAVTEAHGLTEQLDASFWDELRGPDESPIGAAYLSALAALRRLRDVVAGNDDPTSSYGREMSLWVAAERWTPCGDTPEDDDDSPGDKRSRLAATVRINGRNMHLIAIEVGVDFVGCQTAKWHADRHLFDELHAAFHADGHYEAHTIAGRNYAIFLDGYC